MSHQIVARLLVVVVSAKSQYHCIYKMSISIVLLTQSLLHRIGFFSYTLYSVATDDDASSYIAIDCSCCWSLDMCLVFINWVTSYERIVLHHNSSNPTTFNEVIFSLYYFVDFYLQFYFLSSAWSFERAHRSEQWFK